MGNPSFDMGNPTLTMVSEIDLVLVIHPLGNI